MNQYYIYILTNHKNGTLYVGVTNDLIKRIYQHKQKTASQFTTKYSVNKLVYFESFRDIKTAIAREKQLKHWKRQWKMQLIDGHNPDWQDLYQDLT